MPTRCEDLAATMKDRILAKVISQYKYSPNMLAEIELLLDEVQLVAEAICDIPNHFDLDTAIGHQLTLLGEAKGFPRFHCNGRRLASGQLVDYTVDDDDLYRLFIKAKIVRDRSNGQLSEFMDAAKELFGPDTFAYSSWQGTFILGFGQELTTLQEELLPIYKKVLPQVRSTILKFYSGPRPFGFGGGWGGFCDGGWGKITPA